MLYYLLKAEDLLKGFFPKVSLEILYINLFNLSRLRDVEKVIDNLERRDHTVEQAVTAPVEDFMVREAAAEPPRELNAKGFVEYVKKKKPFIGASSKILQVAGGTGQLHHLSRQAVSEYCKRLKATR
jgi:hypothetical protein